MILLKGTVVIPRLAGAAPDLNKTNAAFQQPSSDQQLPTVRAAAVGLLNVLRLAANVERFARF